MQNLLPLIEIKKQGRELSEKDLRLWTECLARGDYADYQVAALLMAIRLNGLTVPETMTLANCMAESGAQLDLGRLSPTVDKHSTGGVSDSTTFIVVPLLALLGFHVAKMSGRSLGFTGGTIDKLESFEGYSVEQSTDAFYKIAAQCGVALTSASEQLAPADKVLYALRDVTGTVDSLPLIAASVMSKKLAAGAEIIVLDVKYGDGALMKSQKDAVALAKLMTAIGNRAGRKTGALVTSMNQPLGEYVGCNLECRGAIEVLKGRRNDLYTVSRALVKLACKLYGRKVSDGEIDALIDSGQAYSKFEEIVQAHGGQIPHAFDTADCAQEIRATESGTIVAVETERIGRINVSIGGGRIEKGQEIFHDVGIALHCRLGDSVKKGDLLCTLYSRTVNSAAAAALSECFTIDKTRAVKLSPLILEEV